MLALNCLNHFGNATPYQAVYGRQPGFLPPVEGQPRPDSVDGRKEQRIRELAIKAMVQASAQAQVYRALKGKGQNHPEYKIGDMVDHHRPTATKDDPTGWHGPVPFSAVGNPGGTMTCRCYGQDRSCRLADVRFSRFIALVYFDEFADSSPSSHLWPEIKTVIS